MDTCARDALGRLAWDALLPVAAEKLDQPEYELLVLVLALDARPDELDAGQVLRLVEILAALGAI